MVVTGFSMVKKHSVLFLLQLMQEVFYLTLVRKIAQSEHVSINK